MAKHRAGDRRIMSISIPEKLAERLDRRVGKGRRDGRSATITRMIQESLDGGQKGPPQTAVEQRKARTEKPRSGLKKTPWVHSKFPPIDTMGAKLHAP